MPLKAAGKKARDDAGPFRWRRTAPSAQASRFSSQTRMPAPPGAGTCLGQVASAQTELHRNNEGKALLGHFRWQGRQGLRPADHLLDSTVQDAMARALSDTVGEHTAVTVHLDLQHGGSFPSPRTSFAGIILVPFEPGQKQGIVIALGPRIGAGAGVRPIAAVAAAFAAGPALVAGLRPGIGGLRPGGGGG